MSSLLQSLRTCGVYVGKIHSHHHSAEILHRLAALAASWLLMPYCQQCISTRRYKGDRGNALSSCAGDDHLHRCHRIDSWESLTVCIRLLKVCTACLGPVASKGVRCICRVLLTQSVRAGPKGVHVAHVLVDGQINETASAKVLLSLCWSFSILIGYVFKKKKPTQKDPKRGQETYLAPDSIANLYWQLHSQDPTVWTFEQDIRPNVEPW